MSENLGHGDDEDMAGIPEENLDYMGNLNFRILN